MEIRFAVCTIHGTVIRLASGRWFLVDDVGQTECSEVLARSLMR